MDITVKAPGLYPAALISQGTDRLIVFTKTQARTLIGELAVAIAALPDE